MGAVPTTSARRQKGKPRPSVVDLLDRAEMIRRTMRDEAVNQAEVARRLNITRARVTQLLNLLTLAPEVRTEVRRLVAAGNAISERTLRPLVGRSYTVQLRALRGRG